MHTTTEATIYATTPSGVEYELCVAAQADVTRGGSSSYDSDEPPWVDVESVKLYSPATGRPVGKRILAAMSDAQWNHISDLLAEA